MAGAECEAIEHERIYSRKYRRHEGHTVLHAGSAEYEHFSADMRLSLIHI